MSLEILEELIEVDSIDRIKEIIVHESSVIKVDNVYNYNS